MLREAGIHFRVNVSGVDENAEGTPREVCAGNARLKAFDIATRNAGEVVLGADTIVVLDGKIFGKPKDMDDARQMLEALCGRVHEVLTGVCLIQDDKICSFVESTRVKFRPLAEVDLDRYLAIVNPLDKAGAYAAQEDDGQIIEKIEGFHSNVVGLPIERVIEALHMHFPFVLAKG